MPRRGAREPHDAARRVGACGSDRVAGAPGRILRARRDVLVAMGSSVGRHAPSIGHHTPRTSSCRDGAGLSNVHRRRPTLADGRGRAGSSLRGTGNRGPATGNRQSSMRVGNGIAGQVPSQGSPGPAECPGAGGGGGGSLDSGARRVSDDDATTRRCGRGAVVGGPGRDARRRTTRARRPTRGWRRGDGDVGRRTAGAGGRRRSCDPAECRARGGGFTRSSARRRVVLVSATRRWTGARPAAERGRGGEEDGTAGDEGGGRKTRRWRTAAAAVALRGGPVHLDRQLGGGTLSKPALDGGGAGSSPARWGRSAILRTSVNLHGDMVVTNRSPGGETPAGPSSVTSRGGAEDCIDRDGDASIRRRRARRT